MRVFLHDIAWRHDRDGFLKEQKVAAYNWGFVDGKTQTIYP